MKIGRTCMDVMTKRVPALLLFKHDNAGGAGDAGDACGSKRWEPTCTSDWERRTAVSRWVEEA